MEHAVTPLLRRQGTGVEALKLLALVARQSLEVKLLGRRVSINGFLVGAALVALTQGLSQIGLDGIL